MGEREHLDRHEEVGSSTGALQGCLPKIHPSRGGGPTKIPEGGAGPPMPKEEKRPQDPHLFRWANRSPSLGRNLRRNAGSGQGHRCGAHLLPELGPGRVRLVRKFRVHRQGDRVLRQLLERLVPPTPGSEIWCIARKMSNLKNKIGSRHPQWFRTRAQIRFPIECHRFLGPPAWLTYPKSAKL